MTSLEQETTPPSVCLGQNGIVAFTRAAPHDIGTIEAMFARCSPEARLRRFFRLLPSAPLGYLKEILDDDHNSHAFVVRRNGEVIGLAELHLTGPCSGDLALIVEDSFHRRGVGTAALELLICRARELGLRSLSADVHLENSHVIRALQRVGATSMRRACDVLHIQVDLAFSQCGSVESAGRQLVRQQVQLSV